MTQSVGALTTSQQASLAVTMLQQPQPHQQLTTLKTMFLLKLHLWQNLLRLMKMLQKLPHQLQPSQHLMLELKTS
jgi:hypothetical protein